MAIEDTPPLIIHFSLQGLTKSFKFYTLATFVFETIIPVVLMSILSILSIRQFNTFIVQKNALSSKKDKLKNLENNFYRMTIILTLVFVFTRAADMIVGILIRCQGILVLDFSIEFMSIVNLTRQICYLFMYASNALSPYIYVTSDLNLKRICKKRLNLKGEY